MATRARHGQGAALAALDAVGQALGSSLELQPLLERALRAMLVALPLQAATVALPDWGTGEIESHTATRRGYEIECSLGRVDRKAPGELSAAGRLLAAPVGVEGRTLGLLAVALAQGHAALPGGRPLLQRLAGRIGQAVQNARLYEAARLEADRLAAVSAVGSAMRQALPISRLLSQALSQVATTTNLDFAVVHLCQAGRGGLRLGAATGITGWLAAQLARDCPLQPEATAGALAIEDIEPQVRGRRSPACLMYVALHSRSLPLGILTVGSYEQRHFAPGAADLMVAVATQIALGLDNARLYREARERAGALARANSALSEALRSKDQFLTNVTHELRRPLAPARLVLETLLEVPPGRLSTERQTRLLRNALDNLDSLNDLVSELLAAARAGHEAQPPSQNLVDLVELTRRALAAMQPLAEGHGLQVRLLAPRSPLKVSGDAQALSRVVVNLLSNAVKFNRDGGSILVQLERTDEGLAVLSVADTGIGIPSHARPHIFERFYQADGSSTRAHEGLGLGLAIAKQTVEEHRGQIRFDTEEGVGTTFAVTLPLA